MQKMSLSIAEVKGLFSSLFLFIFFSYWDCAFSIWLLYVPPGSEDTPLENEAAL